jgi:hypothetical protein
VSNKSGGRSTSTRVWIVRTAVYGIVVLGLVPLYIRDLYDDGRLFRLVSSSEKRANEMARLVTV